MMKELRHLTLFTGLIVFFLLNGHNISWAKALTEKNIDAILIKSAAVGEGVKSIRKNPAILITDATRINQYKSLFLNNYRFVHACGYTYDIQFWSGAQLYEEIPYNMECGLEEFQKNTETISQLMQSVNKQFQTHPDYSIYLLKVPVIQEPLALTKKMKQNGLNVFLFNGLNSRYPSVEVVYTYKGQDHDGVEEVAKKQGNLILADLSKKIPNITEHSSFEPYMSSYELGKTEIELRAILIFKLDTDLNLIMPDIIKSGFDVRNTTVPEYYIIALVDPEEDKVKLKQKLKSCLSCEIMNE